MGLRRLVESTFKSFAEVHAIKKPYIVALEGWASAHTI